MSLCHYLSDIMYSARLSLITGVERVNMEGKDAFFVSCRACNVIHRVEVSLDELPNVSHGVFQDFYNWLMRVHIPREERRAMDIQDLLLAQTIAEVRTVTQEAPSMDTNAQTSSWRKAA